MRLDGPIGRLVQWVAGNPTFARVAPGVVPRLDRLTHRVTGGRFMLTDRGLVPMLVLTATGAKSGQPREVPLACLPDGDGFYVVGSNFGRRDHPAWTANLLAHPDAEVSHAGRRFPVRARLLDAEEKAELWARITEMWPSYDVYTERSGRDLRVFRLERTDPWAVSPAATAASHIEVMNLVHRYAELIDDGDLDGVAALFRQATLVFEGHDGKVLAEATGSDAVRATYAGVVLHEDGTPRTRHVVTNPILSIDEEAGTASCRYYVTVFQRTDDLPLQPIWAIRYEDRFRRVDGTWRLEHRRGWGNMPGDTSHHLR
jgi:deazaflavin-dependent oxidoreductase (nitroreductase family)